MFLTVWHGPRSHIANIYVKIENYRQKWHTFILIPLANHKNVNFLSSALHWADDVNTELTLTCWIAYKFQMNGICITSVHT